MRIQPQLLPRTILLFSTILGLLACGGHEAAHRPNVILVSVDTLRADALSCLGHPGETTPHIDRFLSEGVLFRSAYAEEPHTLPSHVSLFTSVHPKSHGVEGRLRGGRPLSEDVPTLATTLKAEGYATAAFLNGGFLNPRFGLRRGFDVYDYFSDVQENESNATSRHGRSAEQTNAAVFEWLDGTAQRPFFLFVHYFDVHSDWNLLPYDSPDAYRKPRCGEFETSVELTPGEGGGSRFLFDVNRRKVSLTPSDVEEIRCLYDAGVRYLDDRFGELVAGLAERGVLEDSLVAFVSDHGEEFMEHGKVLHTQLFDECLHVPLGIRAPSSRALEPRVVDELVETIDVMPTLLELAGESGPQRACRAGVSCP